MYTYMHTYLIAEGPFPRTLKRNGMTLAYFCSLNLQNPVQMVEEYSVVIHKNLCCPIFINRLQL